MIRIFALMLFAPLVFAPADSHAETRVFDSRRVCDAMLPDPLRAGGVSWNGACTNGKLEGKGLLRGDRDMEIDGDFRDGKLIEGTGRARVVQAEGAGELVRISVNAGLLKVEPLFDMPGRVRIPITPLVGQWKWETAAGCGESYTFEAPDIATALSGGAMVDEVVHLYTVGAKPEWMEVVSLRTSHNLKADCHGNPMGSAGDGELQKSFLRLDAQGKLWRCAKANAKTCSASAVRTASPVSKDAGSERNLITSRKGINVAPPRYWGIGGDLNSRYGTASRPDASVDLILDQNKGVIHAMYGSALRDNPKLEGKVVVEIDIATGGEVADCRIKSSELNAPDFEAKLCARIKQLRFWTRDAPATLVRPFNFFPPG